MTAEERQAHDEEIKRERATLQILSDVIEQATGRAVDLTAWDLDQLVRVLRNPDAVLGVSGALTHAAWGAREGELEARARLIGPHEQVRQSRMGIGSGRIEIAPADYSQLELRILAQLEAAPDTREARPTGSALRDPYRPSNFGLHPYQAAAVLASQRLGEAMHSALAPIAALREAWAAQWPEAAALMRAMRPLPMPVEPTPERLPPGAYVLHGNSARLLVHDDLGDAFGYLAQSWAALPAVPTSIAVRSWIDAPAMSASIDLPKRRRFKQARAQGEARNPMPPAQPFKRARQ